MSPPIITILSDFGSADVYAGIMKGVILGICPQARIVDLTHQVPAQNIAAGALLLRSASLFFPAGTIHLAVVDPGVGSDRAPVLVQTRRASFVGPDNGLLHPAASGLGIERIVKLTKSEYHLSTVSQTFHGRDVFAPVAAHVASGVRTDALGAEMERLTPLNLPQVIRREEEIVGEVIYIDGFGNAVTNIVSGDVPGFPASDVSVSIEKCAPIPVCKSYVDVAAGKAVALIASWGHLEIAVRDGSAARELKLRTGTKVSMRIG